VRVVIADDQALVRGGFRLILKAAGIEVVAEAADGAQAVAAVVERVPDVVLMDIRMPELDGIEATRRILAAGPAVAGVRIIILTTFDLDQYVYAALAAGASGFLLKDVTPEHLVAAVQLVQTGDALLAPSITRRLVERFAPGSASRPAPLAGSGVSGRPGRDLSVLTPREAEVLGLIARGMSNAELAAALTLSEATVKTHVTRILTKLDLRDRVQAVVFAYEIGLVTPGSPGLGPRRPRWQYRRQRGEHAVGVLLPVLVPPGRCLQPHRPARDYLHLGERPGRPQPVRPAEPRRKHFRNHRDPRVPTQVPIPRRQRVCDGTSQGQLQLGRADDAVALGRDVAEGGLLPLREVPHEQDLRAVSRTEASWRYLDYQPGVAPLFAFPPDAEAVVFTLAVFLVALKRDLRAEAVGGKRLQATERLP